MGKFQSRTNYRGVANLRVVFSIVEGGDGWVGRGLALALDILVR